MKNGSSKPRGPGTLMEFDPKAVSQSNKNFEQDASNKNVINNLLSGIRSYKRRYPGQSSHAALSLSPIVVEESGKQRPTETQQPHGQSTPDTSVSHSDTAGNLNDTKAKKKPTALDKFRENKRLLEKQFKNLNSHPLRSPNPDKCENNVVHSATFNKNLRIQIIPLTVENMAAVDTMYPKNKHLSLHDSLSEHPIHQRLKQRSQALALARKQGDSTLLTKDSDTNENEPLQRSILPKRVGVGIMGAIQPENGLVSVNNQPTSREIKELSPTNKNEMFFNKQNLLSSQGAEPCGKQCISSNIYQQNPYNTQTISSEDTQQEPKHRDSIGTLTTTDDLKILSSIPSSPRPFPFDEKEELSPNSGHFLPPVLSIEFDENLSDLIHSPILSPVGTMKMRRDAEMRERLKGLALSSPIDLGETSHNICEKIENPPKPTENKGKIRTQVGLPPKAPTSSSQNEGESNKVTKKRVVVVRKVKKKAAPSQTKNIENDQQRLITETDVEIRRMETRLAELKLMREIQLLEKEISAAKAIAEFRQLSKPNDIPVVTTPKQTFSEHRSRVSVLPSSIPDLTSNLNTPAQTASKSLRGNRTFDALDRYNNKTNNSNTNTYSKNKPSFSTISEQQDSSSQVKTKLKTDEVEWHESPKRSPQRVSKQAATVATNKKVLLMKSAVAQQRIGSYNSPRTPSIKPKRSVPAALVQSPSRRIEQYQ